MVETGLGGLVKSLIRKDREQLHTFTLGIIESFDAEKMRAEVKLLENVFFNGNYYESPMIVDCLVQFPKTKTFYIRMPYEVGDKVVVAFCESNISEIMVGGKTTNQTLTRKHSMDDLVVIGGWISENETKTTSDNIKDIVIVNTKHNSKISFTEDNNINITNVKNINVDCQTANLTANNTNITSTTTINGSTTVNGTLNVSESVTTPSIIAESSLTVSGTEMKAHTHGGVQSGSSSTDPV